MTALKIIKIRLEYTLYVYSIPTDLLLFFYDNVMQLGVYELKILSDFWKVVSPVVVMAPVFQDMK